MGTKLTICSDRINTRGEDGYAHQNDKPHTYYSHSVDALPPSRKILQIEDILFSTGSIIRIIANLKNVLIDWGSRN